MRGLLRRAASLGLGILCLAFCAGTGPYEALAQTLAAPAPSAPLSPVAGIPTGLGAPALRLQPGGPSAGVLAGTSPSLPSFGSPVALSLPAPSPSLARAPSAGIVRAAVSAAPARTTAATAQRPEAARASMPAAGAPQALHEPVAARLRLHERGARQDSSRPAAAPRTGEASPASALRGLGAEVSRRRSAADAGMGSALDAFFAGTMSHPERPDTLVPAGEGLGTLRGRGLARLPAPEGQASPAAAELPPPSARSAPFGERLRQGWLTLGRTAREMLFGEAEFAALRRPYLARMNLSRFLMVVQAVLGTGVAYSTGAFVDAALAHSVALAVPWFSALVGLIVLRTLLGRYLWVLGERIKVGMRQDFRIAFFSHAQRIPASYAGRADAPEMTMRLLYDVGRIVTKNADIPTQTPQLVVQLLMAAGFVLATSWPLALVILASIPLLGFLSVRFARKYADQQRQISLMQADLTRLGQDLFTGNRDGRASGGDELAASVYKARSGAYESMWIEVARLASSYSALRDFLQTAFGELLILGAGFLSFLLLGTPSVGQIMAMRGYAGDLRGAFTGILDRYNDSRAADGGMSRLHELRKALASSADKPEARDFAEAEVSFNGVRYALPGLGQVLRGVQFSARPGERVLVVGGEAASRRSLVDLLFRLDSPAAGSVRAGGADVADLKREGLVSNTALVSGEAAVFPGTLRDNLLLGAARRPSDEELVAALKSAGAASLLDLSRLPKGLDTLVADAGGVPLDAEQRQRLALARAALKRLAVLIGEDVGQGLDPGDARRLRRDFERLSRGRTTLVLEGQPERGEDYDRIVVLQDGIVVESGTHAQLMALGKRYKELVEATRLGRGPG